MKSGRDADLFSAKQPSRVPVVPFVQDVTTGNNAQVMEKRCNQSGQLVFSLFVAYCLLGILLASFTPHDILSYTWARELIGLTALFAPSFLDVPNRSPIPDVVRFYFGVMWMAMPILWGCIVFLSFRWPVACITRPKTIEIMRSRLRAIFLYAAAFVLTIAMFHFVALTNLYTPETGKIARAMFSSRLSVGIGGTLFNFSLLFMATGIAWFPRSFYHAWPKLPWIYKHR